MSRLDATYDLASDTESNIAKTKLRNLAEAVQCKESDIGRIVAWQESIRKESEIQPLVEQVEDIVLQWRGSW